MLKITLPEYAIEGKKKYDFTWQSLMNFNQDDMPTCHTKIFAKWSKGKQKLKSEPI